MSNTAPQSVLFDLDGTLIDSSPSILACFGAVLEEAGIQPLVPLEDSLIGPPLRQTLINLTGRDDEELLQRLVAGFKERYDTEGYKESRVYPGVEALLTRLHSRGVVMAIATNKRRVPTMKIVERLRWDRYFPLVGTLDSIPGAAGKAGVIASLLEELSCHGERSWYVGDKREDGEAAAANGMPFAAAGWGYGEWSAPSLPEGWRLIAAPAELLSLFP